MRRSFLLVCSILLGFQAQADYTRNCHRTTGCAVRISPEDFLAFLMNEALSLNGNDQQTVCVVCNNKDCAVEVPILQGKTLSRFQIHRTGKINFFRSIDVNFLGRTRGIECKYSIMPGLTSQLQSAESSSIPTFPTQYCPLLDPLAALKPGTTESLAYSLGMAAQAFYSAIQIQSPETHCELKHKSTACFQYTYDELKMKEAETILQFIGSYLRR